MSILLATHLDAAELALWRRELEAVLPGEHWVLRADEARPEDIDIAIVANPPSGALAGLPHLRLIQSLWAGVDRLLADASLPYDVPLARMVDPAMNEAMAQTALWAVLSLHRGFFRYARQQREGRWQPLPQRRADEVEVLVLGLGQMGATTAQHLARVGYRVTGWSTRAAQVPGVQSSAGEEALDALLASADIVVNLLPLTARTRDFFDARRFAAMKRGAGFVNLARGAHVVEDDLIAALDSQQLSHAVLDVFRAEPLPAAHAFWSHPHVFLLPHAAAQTDARSAAAVAARNVRAARAGHSVHHLVDRARGY